MQLLSALSAVHDCHVLHRDLKQTNLLLDKNGVLKLCDFGLSRRTSGFGKSCTPDVTSLWYRAPEILLGEKCYGTAVDMWSFGCIFAEWLQHGEPLFQGMSEADQLNVIFKLIGTPSEHSWPQYPTLPGINAGLYTIVEVFFSLTRHLTRHLTHPCFPTCHTPVCLHISDVSFPLCRTTQCRWAQTASWCACRRMR